MFAILPTLGFQEMLVIIVLGVLLFGRNLPDVGRRIGRTVAQLRRGMQEFKDQMDRDESIREIRDAARETRAEFRRAGTVKRALTDPGAAVRDLARSTITAAGEPEGNGEDAGSRHDAAPPGAPGDDGVTDDGVTDDGATRRPAD